MIIFDFDQTLVDTASVQHLRKPGGWPKLMDGAKSLKVYEGVPELFAMLQKAGRVMSIVTHSPDMVPRRFIKLHNWPIEHVIGYHQIGRRKPAPDGLLKAINLANVAPEDAFHIGDTAEDTQAARSAGIISIGAGWGSLDIKALKASDPDYLFSTVAEAARFFKKQ